MKKLGLILTALLLFGATVQASNIDDLFRKYADDERFEYTAMGRNILGIFSAFTDFAEMTEEQIPIQKVTGIKVLQLASDSASKALASRFSDEIERVIAKDKYEALVEKRGKSTKSYVYSRVDKNDDASVVIVAKEQQGITLIWIKGRAKK